MLDVQHFVIEDVFDKPLRHFRRIESLANGYVIVDVIVMAQDTSGSSLRPSECRLTQFVVEVAPVQLNEHAIKIINLTMSGRDHLTSTTASRKI
jgi:hypothetical protein